METIKSLVNSEFPNDSAILHINNGEQTIAPENLKGMVGSKNWTVICDGEQRFRDVENLVKQFSDKLDDVKVELADVNSEMKKIKKVSKGLSKHHVQNLACQMLLFLEGSQPNNQGCHRFRALKAKDKSRIEEFTKEINLNFDEFISSADTLIEQRNMQLHACNVNVLKNRLDEVQEWLKDFPEWKNELSFEMCVMEKWPIIVKYLPPS